MTRRQIVAQMAGTLVLANAPAAQAGGSPMLTRPIPATGEPMPVIGFGTWQTFDVGDNRAAIALRREVLETLFASGGRMIDSSPMYGRAEAVVGSLLAEIGQRDTAFLATKVWTSGERAGIAQMRDSAAKLRSPVIDLMQIHNLVDWRTHLKTLRAWKGEGRFRFIGITHYTTPALDDLATIIRNEKIDFVQFGYSIAARTAEQRLLPVAAERGVAVVANQPFDSGNAFQRVKGKALPEWAAEFDCTSWAQFMLKYIVSHPAVTCAIPGTASPAHARDNVAAGVGRLPGEHQRRRMAELWDGL